MGHPDSGQAQTLEQPFVAVDHDDPAAPGRAGRIGRCTASSPAPCNFITCTYSTRTVVRWSTMPPSPAILWSLFGSPCRQSRFTLRYMRTCADVRRFGKACPLSPELDGPGLDRGSARRSEADSSAAASMSTRTERWSCGWVSRFDVVPYDESQVSPRPLGEVSTNLQTVGA